MHLQTKEHQGLPQPPEAMKKQGRIPPETRLLVNLTQNVKCLKQFYLHGIYFYSLQYIQTYAAIAIIPLGQFQQLPPPQTLNTS
jgi:hypothetical protein